MQQRVGYEVWEKLLVKHYRSIVQTLYMNGKGLKLVCYLIHQLSIYVKAMTNKSAREEKAEKQKKSHTHSDKDIVKDKQRVSEMKWKEMWNHLRVPGEVAPAAVCVDRLPRSLGSHSCSGYTLDVLPLPLNLSLSRSHEVTLKRTHHMESPDIVKHFSCVQCIVSNAEISCDVSLSVEYFAWSKQKMNTKTLC